MTVLVLETVFAAIEKTISFRKENSVSEYPLDYMSKESFFERRVPTTPKNKSVPLSDSNPARWTYEKLVESIYTFEKNIDDEHEIGARLVSSGVSVTIHLKDISYFEPNIITFFGRSEHGEEVQLIQHVSQLRVCLISMKKLRETPVRMGGAKLLHDAEKELA